MHSGDRAGRDRRSRDARTATICEKFTARTESKMIYNSGGNYPISKISSNPVTVIRKILYR